MDFNVKDIYSGNFQLETLPEAPSKVIRVYLACTSTGEIYPCYLKN